MSAHRRPWHVPLMSVPLPGLILVGWISGLTYQGRRHQPRHRRRSIWRYRGAHRCGAWTVDALIAAVVEQIPTGPVQ